MTISREYITMAAIRRPDGTIFRGYRHATIIHEMGGSKHPDVQGFITSQNRFVEREEALKIARAARQMAGSAAIRRICSARTSGRRSTPQAQRPSRRLNPSAIRDNDVGLV